MDLMSIRRGLMAQMAGATEELITIPENNLSNTTNLDAFLETVVSGWNSEFILLAHKSGGEQPDFLIACFSKYINTVYTNGFTQVWRGNANGGYQNLVSRNGWSIRIKQGSIYRIIRNPFIFTINS